MRVNYAHSSLAGQYTGQKTNTDADEIQLTVTVIKCGIGAAASLLPYSDTKIGI